MITKTEIEFLKQSNYIEREYSDEALRDAIKAWEFVKDLPRVEVSDVLKAHKILMGNLNYRIAGRFRECDVYIANEVKRFISIGDLFNRVNDWSKDYNEKLDRLKDVYFHTKHTKCKESHVWFEKIHPFEDGNGRTGRLFYLKMRRDLRLGYKIIKADIDEDPYNGEQAKYYRWFNS